MKFIWIIQDSKGKHFNWTELYKSVINCGSCAVYVSIDQISLYKLPAGYTPIVIGGDDYLNMATKNSSLRKGIFNDEVFFCVDSYMKLWKHDYLNYDTKIVSITNLSAEKPPFFIRPLKDDKSIDGHVVNTFEEIRKIQLQFNKENCLFCVSSVKNINKEWRAVIISNRVVNICRYAVISESSISTQDLPTEMIEFVEMCCQNITNAPLVWVIDIAEYHQKYYVLECNIFNASNYYDCDRQSIVVAVEEALREREKFNLMPLCSLDL